MFGNSDGLKYFPAVNRFVWGLVLGGVWLGVNALPAKAASSLIIAWTQSSNTNVVGYKVYFGNTSHLYTNVIIAGNVTSTIIPKIVGGMTYYIAATTYNAAGIESAYSTEVSYTAPMVAPALSGPALQSANQFSFSVANVAGSQCVVEASTNLIDWIPVQTNISPFTFVDSNAANFQQRYYRTVNQQNN
jgi:hypothetical protein